MSKVAIVYWSGTGNTERMAEEIESSAKEAGAEVNIYTSDDFNKDLIDSYDAIAFGCPAMGDEELEESSFEPMFEACEDHLKGKNIGLFGSYEWNDTRQWMFDWVERCKDKGAVLVTEQVTAYDYPDEEALEKCKNLGKVLATI